MSYVGTITRENAGACLLVGAVYPSDALQMLEPGVQVGAVQIGGGTDLGTCSMFAATCDYFFIGEELYVAGAASAEDPIQLSIVYASDIIKIGLLILMIAFVLLTSMGINLAPILEF
jgi:hypothetical protein